MSALPRGWSSAPLGDIADTSLGKMLDRGKSSGHPQLPYLRNVNVQWGRIDVSDVLTMEMPPEQRESFRLRAGDLLVCEGGEIGRCAVWPGGTSFMAYQKALHRIRPSEAVDARYLRYQLEHMHVVGLLARFATGSTIKHLPQQQLRRLPVRVPPLAEQRRIVEALEDHLSRLDAGVAYLAAVERRLKRLWSSVLEAAIYRPGADDSSGWPESSTGEVAQVQGGIQKQPKRRPAKNRYPFLRVANVPRGGLSLEDVHEVELFEGELERFALRHGDLLVVEGNGSPEQIGRAATWHGEIENCVHQNHLIRVRPNADMDPRFLECVWNAPTTARRLMAVASSTSGLYTLSTAKVKAVRVPVPPLHEQAMAIAEVGRWRMLIESQDATVAASLQRAAGLRRSLLQQAFSGQLMPQDPSDEPASALLERLNIERAAAPEPARRRARPG